MGAHTCNLSAWEAETVGLLQIQGQTELYGEFQVSLGCTERPPQKTNRVCNVSQLVENLPNITKALDRIQAPSSPDVLAHTCNLSIWQVLAGGLGVSAILGNIVRLMPAKTT